MSVEKNTLKYTLLSTIIGLLAGVVGSLVVITGGWPIGDHLTTMDLSGFLQNAPRVTVTFDEHIGEVVRAALPNIVILERRTDSSEGENAAYTPVGYGSVLTNDGWIITSPDVVIEEEIEELVVRTVDGKRYTVVTFYRDQLESILFIKTQAMHLAPIDFAEDESITIGQMALIFFPGTDTRASSLVVNRVAQVDWLPDGPLSIVSSEVSPVRLRLQEPVSQESNGMSVYNIAGEVMGMVDVTGEKVRIVPVRVLSHLSQLFLSTRDVRRTWLGVHYVDLAQSADILPASRTRGLRRGALLAAALDKPAIEKESPAAIAGLKAGDIILEVEGEEANGRNSLTELIQSYSPGAEVTLTFMHEGRQQEVQVKLGELR